MPEISEERLKVLLEAEAKLEALERGGVDNWQFYDDAMEYLEKNPAKEIK